MDGVNPNPGKVKEMKECPNQGIKHTKSPFLV